MKYDSKKYETRHQDNCFLCEKNLRGTSKTRYVVDDETLHFSIFFKNVIFSHACEELCLCNECYEKFDRFIKSCRPKKPLENIIHE